MKNISRITRNACTGCLVCEYVCPVNAISHKADILGFYYPEISGNICIDCGRCLNVCPSEPTFFPKSLRKVECYAANWQNKTYNYE